MKRIISILLSVSMVLTAFSAPSLNVFAGADEAVNLVFGETSDVKFKCDDDPETPECWLKFKPAESGVYQLSFKNTKKGKVYNFYTRAYKSLKDVKNNGYIEELGEYTKSDYSYFVYKFSKDKEYYIHAYTLVNNISKFTCPVVVTTHKHRFKDYFTPAVREEFGEYGKVCKTCGYEKDIKTFNAPAVPASFKVTPGKKKFTAKWKKARGAKKYQLQYSYSKKFKKSKSKTVKSCKKTVKKLKSKKTYYVRIRSYKVVKGHKVYSQKWSKTRKIRVK